ncbi:MAG: hypothetical protein IKO49_07250 [Bacilli bacterium]|nr:hypothetical protein [Bacilli bacterium]
MRELKMIKNKYGEDMMHYCKSAFPTILEREGLLYKLLSENFSFSKLLYSNLVMNKKLNDFNVFIHSLFGREIFFKESNKTVEELMDEAGYRIYLCKSEEDIEKFRKYYRPDELICTFRGGRLETHHVFFAVKKNVDDIKREAIPTRDDKYGTSVISIQFTKGDVNIISIKNRYNTNVKYADNTFDSNLENINPGLTKSFEAQYGLNICDNYITDFQMLNYLKANDKKFYQYNMFINGIGYGPYNTIIDNNNVVDKYQEKEKYIVMDYFILDLENKCIRTYDERIHDSFVDGFCDIDKISVTKDNNTLERTIYITLKNGNNLVVVIDKTNQIVGYYNPNLEEIDNDFLKYNMELRSLYLPNVKKIGDNFLFWNYNMEELNLPNVEVCGDYFIPNNSFINTLRMPKLKNTGVFFIRNKYTSLESVDLDSLEFLTYGSFGNNMMIDELGKVKPIEEFDCSVKKSPLVLRKIS